MADLKPSSENLAEAKASPSPHKKCSNARAVVTLIMGAIGVGVMELPAAMAQAGWIGGLFFLALSGSCCLYMTHVLYRAILMKPAGASPFTSFAAIGQACFGRFGSMISFFAQQGTLLGLSVSLVVLMGETLSRFFPCFGPKVWVLLALCALVPLSWVRSMREVAMMALVGCVSVTGICVVVVWDGLSKWGGAEEGEVQHDLLPENPKLFGASFCTCLLSFGLTMIVPNLIQEMERPQDFPRCANIAYAFIIFAYFIVSVCGYLGYGKDLLHTKSILDAISPASESLSQIGPVGYLITTVVLITAASHYIVLFTPMASTAEAFALSFLPSSSEASPSPLRSFVARSSRSMVALLIVGIALVIPSIKPVVTLLGAVTMCLVAVTLPPLLYLRLLVLKQREEDPKVGLVEVLLPCSLMGKVEHFLFFMIVLIGGVALVVGVYGAALQFQA